MPEQNGDSFCSYKTNLIHMSIDDTLFKALADLKIAGQIQKENLLNNLGVESNMKLYSHAKTGKLDNLRPGRVKRRILPVLRDHLDHCLYMTFAVYYFDAFVQDQLSFRVGLVI